MRKKNRSFTGCIPSIVKLVVVTFLIISPAVFVSAGSPAEAKDEMALRIIYSGGLKGNIKPCG